MQRSNSRRFFGRYFALNRRIDHRGHVLSRFQTIHFDIGNIGTPVLAPNGTPDPDAMATFGQLNIHEDTPIEFMHMHIILDGSTGAAEVEMYRFRDSVHTHLGTFTQTAGAGDFNTTGLVPTGSLAQLKRGDYLFCQATTASLFTAGGGDGLTLDIHFGQK